MGCEMTFGTCACRINVTEVSLLISDFRRQNCRGGTNKRTTFNAAGSLAPHARSLEFSVRLFAN